MFNQNENFLAFLYLDAYLKALEDNKRVGK